ncbi:MAG: MurR/RpiR family transcriptional regulator [Deltaproteobacteria bacterium]|nr:MurR/RpiR family transcriptional regulator [Deltaproteobacteria bacterium]MBW1961861.1 MurR/RpiR family transcriptional regulator [Deltaproteobacteria bacterium]MBW2153266.1 MurR/RpiR family transcriptional regulator [Deltaproteobacteria bacterium]
MLDKIQSEYQNFTASQQKVAEYIAGNMEEAFVLNATELAQRVEVSEATITRFISRLGYSGFSEFKRAMGRQVLRGLSTTERLAESAETFGRSKSVLSEILRGDIDNIRSITRQVPEEQFEEAVGRLSCARSIYVLGLRSSHSLALYLAFNLRFFLKSVNLLKPGIGDMPEQVLDSRRDDVLIAISFKRYTREVFEIAEKVKKKGVYLIAITNARLSPLAQLADKALIVKTEIPAYIDSYTAPMSLINAFITAIALRKKKTAMPALKRLEKEFEEYRTYLK